MTRVDEFDSFFAASFADVVQVTYAVAGDRQVAHEATVDAYRRAWRDWSKIRDKNPLAYVRNEAWKLSVLTRGTHPLRRRHEEDGDTALLDALAELTVDDRRLIVLMTLGHTDLEQASREVGVTDEVGIESVTTALAALETALGQSIDDVERRMHGLSAVTETLEAPDASVVRSAARRGRQRNTLLLVAAAVALIVGGGFVVTDGDALASRSSLPYREKIGAERPDVVLDAQELGTDNLLTTAQVGQLDAGQSWSVDSTDEDVANTTPYSTCPTQRFADADPLRVFVRTYKATGVGNERVAQSIEVSKSDKVANEAYRRLVSWYADCQHPRVQLVEAYTVRRPIGDFQILRLVSHRSPERTLTVGFSHSGTVTSTLVHEVDGDEGPDITTFAETLNDSVSRVCQDSGGECTDDIEVMRVEPPLTTTAPQFLGIVDLPPIADVDSVWAGTDPVPATTNPAATVCDKADFSGAAMTDASSRLFVIPEATGLPPEFGVAETVGLLESQKKATRYTQVVADRVAACATENLSARVDQASSFQVGQLAGQVWRISLEVTPGSRVYYRMGVVRRGSAVAQVTFTPAGENDITQKEFIALVQRAGSRLGNLLP